MPPSSHALEREPIAPAAVPEGVPAADSAATPDVDAVAAGADAGWWAQVQADIAASEYQARLQRVGADQVWQASNRAQGFRTTFGAEGVTLLPRSSDGAIAWEWGLRLAGYGTPDQVQPIGAALGAPDSLTAADNLVRYQWSSAAGAIEEWYVNSADGLKQNFTVATPPVGAATDTLVLDVRQHGDLRPTLHADGQGVTYASAGGAALIEYAGLYVYDAHGKTLPAQITLRPDGLRFSVDARGAYYPITIDPLATTPTWSAEGDRVNANFGFSVARAGDVNGDGFADVIVGALLYTNGETDEGAAFLYLGSANGLSASATWSAESDQVDARFGNSVAGTGDVNGDGFADVIVGARFYTNGQTNEGAAFLYLGGGADGRTLQPQAQRSADSTPIAVGGRSDSETSFRLALQGINPLGRGDVRLEWEVQPYGAPFTGTPTGVGDWVDSGTAGVALNELVTGLSSGKAYRWQVRVGYRPPSAPWSLTSRWVGPSDALPGDLHLRTADFTPPTVTINQAVGQADPTNSGPITFTVEFSEPVSGFGNADITLGGTAPGTLVASVSGSGASYTVSVSGMTNDGSVTAAIAAGIATDAAGNLNTAATSTDNTVTYTAPETVFRLYLPLIHGNAPSSGTAVRSAARHGQRMDWRSKQHAGSTAIRIGRA